MVSFGEAGSVLTVGVDMMAVLSRMLSDVQRFVVLLQVKTRVPVARVLVLAKEETGAGWRATTADQERWLFENVVMVL